VLKEMVNLTCGDLYAWWIVSQIKSIHVRFYYCVLCNCSWQKVCIFHCRFLYTL